MATRARSQPPAHYLGFWAVLMSIAMAYLAAVSLRPDVVAAIVPPIKIGALLLDEDDREIRAAAAETETLRRQLFAARAELNGIRGELARRTDRETSLAMKLAAVEAREARLAEAEAELAASRQKPAAAPRVVEKQRALKAATLSAVERLAAAAGTRQAGNATAPDAAAVPAAPTETASIGGAAAAQTSKADSAPTAIRLGTGPSVDALRLNWVLLSQRHQAILQKLQPRYTASRGSGPEGATFDLIAGPLPNAADAQRLCDALRAQNVGCRVGTFGGNAL